MTDPTHPDPYAPRRKGPAADIVDLHDRPHRMPSPPVAEFTRIPSDPPPPAPEPTDVQYVAMSFDRLRHLDLKHIVKEMFGGTMPKDEAEAMDKIAEWSAGNTYPKVQA